VLTWSVLAGCGSAREVRAGGQDNGTQIELEQGQTLAITLDSNPTTGFSWVQDNAQGSDVLVQIGEPEFNSRSNRLGSGGTETLRFRADRPGETTLTLTYRRPWEKDAKPAETYTLEVSVR
jgi:inhibitor of cysteine peptidase